MLEVAILLFTFILFVLNDWIFISSVRSFFLGVAYYLVLYTHAQLNRRFALPFLLKKQNVAMYLLVTDYLKENEVDLLLLDIHMPEVNGIQFLELNPEGPKTILTTAYSEYAAESYEHDVVDYLFKPISYNRFLKAVQRFLSLQQPYEPFIPQTLSIKVDKEIVQINETSIDYIQSLGNYVKVFVGDTFYLASATTQEVLSALSPRLFVRIHKSYAVNLTKITTYTEKEVEIEQTLLPIGITFKRELFKRLKEMRK